MENVARGTITREMVRHTACKTPRRVRKTNMVDPELDALRREFLGEAREKVREIEAMIGKRSPQERERITYLAHQLKGSGGSYGFQNISTEAAAVEKVVETMSDGDAEAQIRRHVESLRAEIDRRQKDLS